MADPLITVVLPVHNGMPFLPAALQSIRDQTFPHIKIIAINDGSADGSAAYLDSIDDPRLTVIHQPRAGLGAVLNRGIDLCETPFLARMDADDISLPDRLEQQLARLQQEPTLVAISSPLDFLVSGKVQRGLPYPIAHDSIVHDLMHGGSGLCHPALLMRADAARAVRYRIAGAGEDLDFCLRLAEFGRVSNLESVQYLYRFHSSSISMTKRGELQCGYAYAVLTARERRQGRPETSFAEYRVRWTQRSLRARFQSWRTSVSYNRYRRARLAWAARQHSAGLLHLAISVALQPAKSLQLIARKVRSRRRSTSVIRTASLSTRGSS